MVLSGIAIELEPWSPIFEKCPHLREKGGVLMLFKTTPHLGAKAQYTGFWCYKLQKRARGARRIRSVRIPSGKPSRLLSRNSLRDEVLRENPHLPQ